jgi:hypothetical protein
MVWEGGGLSSFCLSILFPILLLYIQFFAFYFSLEILSFSLLSPYSFLRTSNSSLLSFISYLFSFLIFPLRYFLSFLPPSIFSLLPRIFSFLFLFPQVCFLPQSSPFFRYSCGTVSTSGSIIEARRSLHTRFARESNKRL